ncbi:hypothetical protein F2Q69_00002654, partial [Brassica cretica]
MNFPNMIRPDVDYHIKHLDIRPPPSSGNSIFINVDTLSDGDIQLVPSVLIHISLRSLSLPYIRDLIQGQLTRRGWLGPEISTAATQLGFSHSELLQDPPVTHRWLSDYLAPRISDLATELGYGRNGFCLSIVVKIITQSPFKYEVLSRMVQQGKTNTEELKSSQMETESCSICLDNLVSDDGSSSKRGVPTRITSSHVFHDGGARKGGRCHVDITRSSPMEIDSLLEKDFPQTETCELLILDRSIDQIAPLIHEWTYDAMCHDLLKMEGNKYTHEVPSKTGDNTEKKEVLLDEEDPIWVELRDVHIADASERLHEKMTNFVSKNKAAQLKQSSKDFGDLSSKDLQKMVHALPQYSEQIDKLSLHVDIARTINRTIMEQGLRELGQLEQDLVFGDAGRKDVIKFLSTNNDINQESKLRLMMIFSEIYPKKFAGEKGRKMMELAKLSGDDVVAVNNLRLLGPVHTECKSSTTGSFPLKFDVLKTKRAARRDRVGDTQTWMLSRFYPIIEELVEKLNKGHLPKQDYPCMNEPRPTFYSSSQSPSASPVLPHSRRTPSWARRHLSDDGYF